MSGIRLLCEIIAMIKQCYIKKRSDDNIGYCAKIMMLE